MNPRRSLGRPIQKPQSSNDVSAQWRTCACQLIKDEVADQGIGYAGLADRLAVGGIRIAPTVLNRRINRQKFDAGFLLACLYALGVKHIRLDGQFDVVINYGTNVETKNLSEQSV